MDIKVLTTTNMMSILNMLVTKFETTSGHRAVVDHGGATPIRKRIANGEAADVVIHSRSTLNELATDGCIKPASLVDVARIPVGVAVRAGTPKPEIMSVETLTRALLAASSIAYPDPAGGSLGGIYVVDLLQQLGIADRLKAKTSLTAGATAAPELVAGGGAEMAIDQIAQLRHVPGLDLVALPVELDAYIVMSAALAGSVQQPQAATAFLDFLASPAAAPAIRAKGMEPC